MAVNKVEYGNTTIIDITDTTAVASDVSVGKYFYTADGVKTDGSYVAPTPRTASDVTVSGATVTIPSGAYASQVQKSVASGSVGTPTASKGSVSNHTISITPSVVCSTGYITGGTKTGTAITVSASELVSGTKTITENGTGIDVSNYASVDVNIAGGGGTITVTKVETINYSYNGTWDQCTFAGTTSFDFTPSSDKTVPADFDFVELRRFNTGLYTNSAWLLEINPASDWSKVVVKYSSSGSQSSYGASVEYDFYKVTLS